MTEVSPARQKRSEERLDRIVNWLQINRIALTGQRGRMWVEWDYDKIKVGIETSAEDNIGEKHR